MSFKSNTESLNKADSFLFIEVSLKVLHILQWFEV